MTAQIVVVHSGPSQMVADALPAVIQSVAGTRVRQPPLYPSQERWPRSEELSRTGGARSATDGRAGGDSGGGTACAWIEALTRALAGTTA